MTAFVMRIIGLAGGARTRHALRYVVDCDFEANDGMGQLHTATDVRQARQWPHAHQVIEYWQTISSTRMWRDDGKPNRPLSAYTIRVMSVAAALDELKQAQLRWDEEANL